MPLSFFSRFSCVFSPLFSIFLCLFPFFPDFPMPFFHFSLFSYVLFSFSIFLCLFPFFSLFSYALFPFFFIFLCLFPFFLYFPMPFFHFFSIFLCLFLFFSTSLCLFPFFLYFPMPFSISSLFSYASSPFFSIFHLSYSQNTRAFVAETLFPRSPLPISCVLLRFPPPSSLLFLEGFQRGSFLRQLLPPPSPSPTSFSSSRICTSIFFFYVSSIPASSYIPLKTLLHFNPLFHSLSLFLFPSYTPPSPPPGRSPARPSTGALNTTYNMNYSQGVHPRLRQSISYILEEG